MNLYTVVTNDEYELPVSEPMPISGVAKFLGITVNTAFKQLHRTPVKAKYKILKTGEKKQKKCSNREYGRRYRMEHDRREYFRDRARKMSNLDLALYYMMNFPPGTLVRLSDDYPNDEPHEVSGIEVLNDKHYIRFADGKSVCAEREEMIQKI